MRKNMKKVLLFVLTVSILSSAFGLTAMAEERQTRAEKYLCFVSTDGGNLNCRSGAGEEYSIVGRFKNGTQLSWSVFGASDSQGRDWTGVGGPDINNVSIQGWVLDSYLRFEPPAKAFDLPVAVDPTAPDVG